MADFEGEIFAAAGLVGEHDGAGGWLPAPSSQRQSGTVGDARGVLVAPPTSAILQQLADAVLSVKEIVSAILSEMSTLGGGLGALLSRAVAIEAKTDALPSDPASAGQMQAIVSALGLLPGAVWDQARAAHVASGTYGELMRLLKQVLSGRVKIDAVSGTETVFQEDRSTPLQTSHLLDVTGAAAGLNATERTAAT